MPQIRVLLGYQQGQVYALDARPFVIGREATSDIVLAPESPASRKHAEITCDAGEWMVCDLGSRNGTLINGAAFTRASLNHNDEITIGENVFVFEYNDRLTAETEAAASRAFPLEPEGLQNQQESQTLVKSMPAIAARLSENMSTLPAGYANLVRDVFTAILAGGHCLLLGLSPSVKTTLIRSIGGCLGLKAGRISLTPTMTGIDVAGTDVLDKNPVTGIEEPRLLPGPLFSNVFMVEGIHTASSKAQTTILSAMKDRRLLLTEKTWPLPTPFTVLAALERIDSGCEALRKHGFFDQFMFRIEAAELDLPADVDSPFASVITAEEITRLQAVIRDFAVDESLVGYAVRIACASRPPHKAAPAIVKRCVADGVEANVAYALLMAAKARAVLGGRLNVTIEDIQCAAKLVMRGRLRLNENATRERVAEDTVIRKILDAALPARD